MTSSPKLKVKTIFTDIDMTLTAPRTAGMELVPDECLAALISAQKKMSLEKAGKTVQEFQRSNYRNMAGNYWPFGLLDQLGIAQSLLWDEVARCAGQLHYVFPDAKKFLIRLKRDYPQIRIYPATTNPGMVIYAKLSAGGKDLANETGSRYLDGAFGGEEVVPGGKSSSHFFTALLERTNADPETTLMIGDDPEKDYRLPEAAGIKQTVLVRRGRQDDIVYRAGGPIYLKSLEPVFDIMEPPV
ncbi:MAG: HAD hydrolase-like protein [Victivallaceae bacterium]|nr:HAD hydrolase-like protein [Victivallaceae bacterium]